MTAQSLEEVCCNFFGRVLTSLIENVQINVCCFAQVLSTLKSFRMSVCLSELKQISMLACRLSAQSALIFKILKKKCKKPAKPEAYYLCFYQKFYQSKAQLLFKMMDILTNYYQKKDQAKTTKNSLSIRFCFT